MPTLIRALLACCDRLVISALGWGACLGLYGGVGEKMVSATLP